MVIGGLESNGIVAVDVAVTAAVIVVICMKENVCCIYTEEA